MYAMKIFSFGHRRKEKEFNQECIFLG